MTSSFESTASSFSETEFLPDVPGNFVANTLDSSPDQLEDDNLEAQELRLAQAFEAGREQGLASAQTLCEPAIQALGAAAAELSAQRQSYLEAQRGLLAELAVDIAEKIIGRELSEHPEWIVDRIAATLELIDSKSPVIVELNPENYAVATGNLGSVPLPENVELVANRDLEAGDFLVACGSTSIDARLASILAGVRQALTGLETLPETTTEPTLGTNE